MVGGVAIACKRADAHAAMWQFGDVGESQMGNVDQHHWLFHAAFD